MKIKNLLLIILSLTFATETPYVIMVSFDGFRYDYPDVAETPNFDYFRDFGVKAKSMQPVFPSETFPNHYALATGAYSKTNMITGNRFWDKKFKELYKLSDKDKVRDGKFYQAEPIWVTAERQSVKSGSFFWVGSEAKIKGFRPSVYKHYDGKVPFRTRVDSVISWLQYPEEKRPHLIMLYFSEPDHTGHELGPDAVETIKVIEEMDEILGYLFKQTKQLDISDEINFVIVSDHGMTKVSMDKTIIIDDYINDVTGFHSIGSGPLMQLNFKENKSHLLDDIYNSLNAVPNLSTYKKEKIPKRFHFNNRNTGDLLLLADDGWLVLRKGKEYSSIGTHGFDNELKSMHSIFYAFGPKIKSGVTIEPFENIHVYPLVCKLLNIKPYSSSIDGPQGKLEVLEPILINN